MLTSLAVHSSRGAQVLGVVDDLIEKVGAPLAPAAQMDWDYAVAQLRARGRSAILIDHRPAGDDCRRQKCWP